MNISLRLVLCIALLSSPHLYTAEEQTQPEQEITAKPAAELTDEMFKNFWAEYENDVSVKPKEPTIFEPFESYLSLDLVTQLLESCHERIKLLINRAKHAAYASRTIRPFLTTDKLLLVGPPGVGKSDLAKAIAQALGRPFVFIQSSLLATEYQNSGSQNLKRVITAAKEYGMPCVVILDEIYSLIEKKKNEQKNDQDTSVALWQLIDECSQDKNILFIGTTNSLKDIPEALKSRFSNHVVEIGLPVTVMRKNIINFYARECAGEELLKTIVKKTEGFSARELKELIYEMRACAAMRGSEMLTQQDLTDALKEMQRCKKLFQTPLKEQAIDLLKSNVISTVTLGLSIIDMCLRYKGNPVNTVHALTSNFFNKQTTPQAQNVA